MQLSFPKGPSLRALFYIKGLELKKVDLALSSSKGFIAEFPEEPPFPPLIEWLEGYCSKKPPALSFSLCISSLPPFTQKVLHHLLLIPLGELLTYGEVAVHVGNPLAYRAVGSACGRNPFPLLIPCHRVIRAQTALGGFRYHIKIKQKLLDFETR